MPKLTGDDVVHQTPLHLSVCRGHLRKLNPSLWHSTDFPTTCEAEMPAINSETLSLNTFPVSPNYNAKVFLVVEL